jgi:hypothetical protein
MKLPLCAVSRRRVGPLGLFYTEHFSAILFNINFILSYYKIIDTYFQSDEGQNYIDICFEGRETETAKSSPSYT